MNNRVYVLYSIMLVVVMVNSLLWLDSIDRYLNSRYHLEVSLYFPEQVYRPSRFIREVFLQSVSVEAGSAATRSIQEKQAPAPDKPELKVSMAASSGHAEIAAGVSISTIVPPSASAIEMADVQALPVLRPPKILFAGDSMMQGVAPLVISHLRKEKPEGTYLDISMPGTGLASRKYYDWPANIREYGIKHDINTLVIFLGPNDPWDIFEGRKRFHFPSDDWVEKYRSRVDVVLEFARSNGMRVIWVGLPAMMDERLSKGAQIENRVFIEETKKYQFSYLDTEEFLGKADKPYSKYITDPKKGKLAVRQDDGVHFTRLGLRMISSKLTEMIKESL